MKFFLSVLLLLLLLCCCCTNALGQEEEGVLATSSNLHHQPYQGDSSLQTSENADDDDDNEHSRLHVPAQRSNTDHSCPAELSQCREELSTSLDRIRQLESSKCLLQSKLESEQEILLSEKNASMQQQVKLQEQLLSQCRDEVAEWHNRIRELESSQTLLQSSSLEYEREMAVETKNALADDSQRQLKWMQADRKRILAQNHELQQERDMQQRQTDKLQTELLSARFELLALHEKQQQQQWSGTRKTYYYYWKNGWRLCLQKIQQWGSEKYRKGKGLLQLEDSVLPLIVEKFRFCQHMLEKGCDVVYPIISEKLCYCWKVIAMGFRSFDTELRTHLDVTYPEYSSFLDGGCQFCGFVSTFTQLMQAPWPLVASTRTLHSHCDYVVLYGVLSIGVWGVIYILWSLMSVIRSLCASRKSRPKTKTCKMKTE